MFNTSLNPPQFKPTKANQAKGGIGGAIGNFLGFDPTPNYNLTWGGFKYNGPAKNTNKKSSSNKSITPAADENNAGSVASAYSTGSGGASDYNPADLAYLEDARARLQRQMQSANRTKANGLTQLKDTYNQEVSGANTDRSRALEDFNLKREDTTRAKDQAITKVNTNARTLADSLRRRIGMASGSGSSAYQVTAPGAVARDASQQRTGVVENYGINFRNLGQAETRAKSDFEDYLDKLSAQYKQRQSDFLANVYDQQSSIDQSLAEVARQEALVKGGGYGEVKSAMSPYLSSMDNRQNAIDNLFAKYRTPYSVEKVKVNTPSLRDYTTDSAGVEQAQQEGDQYAPYLLPLQRENQDQLSLY